MVAQEELPVSEGRSNLDFGGSHYGTTGKNI